MSAFGHRILVFVFISVPIILTGHGCITRSPHLVDLKKQGFHPFHIVHDGFHIEMLVKKKGMNRFLTVYIEGDGFAWKNRYVVSKDPTPKKSIALSLATVDPGLKIAYLSRPCMYSGIDDRKCQNSIYWTSHRYSMEVVNVMDHALNRLKTYTETDKIELIGYSGGGTIAVLLAAFRNDIVKMTTIAANLDHTLWTRLHGVTPLYGSLNAADYAEKVQHIPQVHFVGNRDAIVNGEIVRAYGGRMSDRSKTKITVMNEYTHSCCWEKHWVELLKY